MEKTLIVKVILTDYANEEEEIFESEYELEPGEENNLGSACAHALSIAYHGCAD